MSQPLLEPADLIHIAGTAFIERNRNWIHWTHIKVLLAIARCRTAALGGHIDECTRCGHRATTSYTCRNRHCPKCQTGAREHWLQARQRELLPSPYVHVVFTLHRNWLRSLCRTKRSSTVCCCGPAPKPCIPLGSATCTWCSPKEEHFRILVTITP
jgi:hypothetical protein